MSFFNFVKNNFPAVLKWTGAEVAAEQVFKKHMSSLGSTTAPTPAPEEKKEEAPKAAPATKAPAGKKEPPAPVKKLMFKTWEIANYINDTVEFSAEEVQPGMTFNFFNCEKSKFKINGKCKNIMMSRCKKCEFTVEETISFVEVIKCEDTKIWAIKSVPQVSVQLSNCVGVFVTPESKARLSVETTASQSVSITFPKEPGTYDPENEEDSPEKCYPIVETLITKLKGNALDTKLQEGIE